jgi:hypothetical protein
MAPDATGPLLGSDSVLPGVLKGGKADRKVASRLCGGGCCWSGVTGGPRGEVVGLGVSEDARPCRDRLKKNPRPLFVGGVSGRDRDRWRSSPRPEDTKRVGNSILRCPRRLPHAPGGRVGMLARRASLAEVAAWLPIPSPGSAAGARGLGV